MNSVVGIYYYIMRVKLSKSKTVKLCGTGKNYPQWWVDVMGIVGDCRYTFSVKSQHS